MQTKKETVWLYDWSRPLLGFSTNLHAMTRIDASHAGNVVLVPKDDDRNELAILALHPGMPYVVNPRHVVGLIEVNGTPVRITSLWRLRSLGNWLRLRLRYLVFQGPGKLILQGHRGVRCSAAGQGQAISQAAIIGFDATLTYSVTRCETFASYLSGAQELFHDSFEGEGVYLYEVSPHGAQRAGPSLWWQRFVDAWLRVFGIG
jgi:uncharacterized protein (AIM24 family)